MNDPENDPTRIMPIVGVDGDTVRIPPAWPKTDGHATPTVDVTPGELDQLASTVRGRLAEVGDEIHLKALLARFVPIDFIISEAGIYVRVRRDTHQGGWFVWRAILFRSYEQIIPDVIGIYDERDEALQAASDTVDRLLKEMEEADTGDLPQQDQEESETTPS